jgi:hypothetical protein
MAAAGKVVVVIDGWRQGHPLFCCLMRSHESL